MRAEAVPADVSFAPAAESRPAGHPLFVRITHWIHAAAFVGLVISGAAILLAHPRLYWGETGAFGTPPLINLPLPLWLGHSGWGRYLHFLSAWIAVFTGLVYVVTGIATGHVRRALVDDRADADAYDPLQRAAYLIVVFLLLPLVILTGLGMSPAIASVVPVLVNTLGGQQSARTFHFFTTLAVVIFALGHVAMVIREGFVRHMRAMILGRFE